MKTFRTILALPFVIIGTYTLIIATFLTGEDYIGITRSSHD